jgi:hypothetical protein
MVSKLKVVDPNKYYSIAIMRKNAVLYRMRSLFPSRASAKQYANDIPLDKNLFKVQKIAVIVI